jgi:hypothetical protein
MKNGKCPGLTLGQMADACVYVGGDADVDSKASGSILFRNVKIEPAEVFIVALRIRLLLC